MQNDILSTDTSREFWKKQNFYPSYGNLIKKRRLYETAFLTEWIWKNNPASLADIGCGNGSTITMLIELTDIINFYAYDISLKMLEKIDTRNKRGSIITTQLVDLCDNKIPFENVDVTTILGVHMYLTDDQIKKQFENISSKTIILRDPCGLFHEEINKFSDALGEEYSAVYRTKDEYIKLYEECGYKVTYSKRAYPDDIESDFGTHQYFFICER
jgi:SAM-dependent methyltransferase|tara:strand:- start:3012 stop:3656 length:645 start_codon:yes stop_codon:yes gene_type:complete